MLILTRRLGETITIGESIRVTVLGIKGHQVRLGIEAPESIEIHREEVYRRIQAERASASQNETSKELESEER